MPGKPSEDVQNKKEKHIKAKELDKAKGKDIDLKAIALDVINGKEKEIGDKDIKLASKPEDYNLNGKGEALSPEGAKKEKGGPEGIVSPEVETPQEAKKRSEADPVSPSDFLDVFASLGKLYAIFKKKKKNSLWKAVVRRNYILDNYWVGLKGLPPSGVQERMVSLASD